jgi:hypothetical protein
VDDNDDVDEDTVDDSFEATPVLVLVVLATAVATIVSEIVV